MSSRRGSRTQRQKSACQRQDHRVEAGAVQHGAGRGPAGLVKVAQASASDRRHLVFAHPHLRCRHAAPPDATRALSQDAAPTRRGLWRAAVVVAAIVDYSLYSLVCEWDPSFHCAGGISLPTGKARNVSGTTSTRLSKTQRQHGAAWRAPVVLLVVDCRYIPCCTNGVDSQMLAVAQFTP